MIRHAVLMSLLACAPLCAGDAPQVPPGAVAVVGGEPVAMRALETALLRKEGVDELMKWLGTSLERLDWERIADDAPIITVGSQVMTRRMLATMLLKQHGGKVREELISLAATRQAIARAGIVVDEALLDAEWAATEAEFVRRAEAKGRGRVDFASWLRAELKTTPEEYRAQESFRMQAALHELVRRTAAAALTDSDLQAWLDAHRERFDEREAVRVATIFLPYRDVPEGAPVPPEERERVIGIARQLHAGIAANRVTFARTWNLFGKANEPDAGLGGDLGFVDRQGRRDVPGSRRLPAAVVDAAFGWAGAVPRLLEPVLHDQGADIPLVLGRRSPRSATLADDRQRLIADIVIQDMERRTRELLERIRRETTVVYGDLAEPAATR